jgi:hypothetical protein
MKPVASPPAQPEPIAPPTPMNDPPPHWLELPSARRQELISLLATLLLRQWPAPPNTSPEVRHDLRS